MDRVGTPEEPIPRGRLAVVAGFVFLTFALFSARLFELQVVQGEELRLQSARNSVRTMRLAAPRGDMLDREGRLIASTRPAFHVEVMPSELQRADATFRTLGSLLGRDPVELRARFGTPRGRARFQPVELAADLEFEALARVEEHRHALPGVLTEARPHREYPDGNVLGHLLGSLGEIRADQLERSEYEGYRQGEVIGQSGLEFELERWLRGTAGGRNVVVNVAGREVERLDEVEPVPGNTAILTLDLDLQREAVAAFELPWTPPKTVGADVTPPRACLASAKAGSPLRSIRERARSSRSCRGRRRPERVRRWHRPETLEGIAARRMEAAAEPRSRAPIRRLDVQSILAVAGSKRA